MSTTDLQKRLDIAEARIRVQDNALDRLPRTLDGSIITPGIQVFVPFKGIIVARSGFRADGYRDDTVATIEWRRGKPAYTLECEYQGYNVPCYASAQACVLANPKNRDDTEWLLELALAAASPR